MGPSLFTNPLVTISYNLELNGYILVIYATAGPPSIFELRFTAFYNSLHSPIVFSSITSG
jgi:hypothetical protein